MKKIATLLVLIFLAKLNYAQDSVFRKFRFGLKAAPNVSWLKSETENLTKIGSKLKFSYGFMSEYYFDENYGITFAFELLNSGGALSYPDSSFYDNNSSKFFLKERTFKLNYGLIPITLKMKTNEIGYLTYFGQFGINTLFRTRAAADDIGVDSSRPLEAAIKTNKDIIDEVNLINFGLNLGFGAEYNLYKSTKLLTSLNWNKGFTNALIKESKNIKTKTLSKAEQKVLLNYVSLSLGILF